MPNLCLTGTSLLSQLIKNPAVCENYLGLIPGLGRSPGEGKVYALQYSGLQNSMDCTVHGVTKSQLGMQEKQDNNVKGNLSQTSFL